MPRLGLDPQSGRLVVTYSGEPGLAQPIDPGELFTQAGDVAGEDLFQGGLLVKMRSRAVSSLTDGCLYFCRRIEGTFAGR